MIRRATSSLFVIFALLGTLARAKDVHLEWEPIEGATGYEFEISRNGESVVKRRVEGTSWGVKLPPGVYVFRLRAIDWAKQAGEWSEPSALLSSPAAPEIVNPQPQAIFAPPDAARGIAFRWKPVPGVSKYKVEIQRGGQPGISEIVDQPGYLFKDATPESYEVRVAGVIELTGKLPKGIDTAIWEGDPSAWVPFRVGKPDPVALPKPLVDNAEEQSTSLAVMPASSFFRLAMTDPGSAAGASVVSKLNFGLAIDLGMRLNAAWGIRLRQQFLSTALGTVSGLSIDSSEKTIAQTDFSIGYRPVGAPRLELRLQVKFGETPLAQMRSGVLGYQPVGLVRIGGGFGVPLFKLLTFQLGVQADMLAILSRSTDGIHYRNGLSFTGVGTAERTLWGSWYLKGFLGFTSIYVNASNLTTVLDEVCTGAGLEYRF